MTKPKAGGAAGAQPAGESGPKAKRIVIRDGSAADIPGVIALDALVTGLPKPTFWQAFFDPRGAGRGDARHFLVAEPAGGGALYGFIIGEVRAWEFGSPPCGWVFALSVDPAARLSGIGSRLLSAIEDRFRAGGINRMRTMMARDNHVLMSFFRSQGMMAGPYIELEKDLDE